MLLKSTTWDKMSKDRMLKMKTCKKNTHHRDFVSIPQWKHSRNGDYRAKNEYVKAKNFTKKNRMKNISRKAKNEESKMGR